MIIFKSQSSGAIWWSAINSSAGVIELECTTSDPPKIDQMIQCKTMLRCLIRRYTTQTEDFVENFFDQWSWKLDEFGQCVYYFWLKNSNII